MIGYVYLFYDGSYYKIGHTNREPKKRLEEVQIYNPNKLHLINSHKTINYKKIEYLLHRRYSHKNIRGEWFDLSDDEVDNFSNKCKELENEIIIMKDNPFY